MQEVKKQHSMKCSFTKRGNQGQYLLQCCLHNLELVGACLLHIFILLREQLQQRVLLGCLLLEHAHILLIIPLQAP